MINTTAWSDTHLPSSTRNGVYSITSSFPGGMLGQSVRNAGDVNKDGFDDLIIGAPEVSLARGAAYVVFGRSTELSNIDLASPTFLTSNQGFTITGASPGSYFGYSVSGVGDFNKDGFADIIIGAPGASSPLTIGAVYILFGKSSGFTNIDLASTSLTSSNLGFKLVELPPAICFGISVKTVGDFNKDGFDDVIIGASGPLSTAGLLI